MFVKQEDLSKLGKRNTLENNVKNCKKGSNIAKHAWDYDHKIDFESGKVIDNRT